MKVTKMAIQRFRIREEIIARGLAGNLTGLLRRPYDQFRARCQTESPMSWHWRACRSSAGLVRGYLDFEVLGEGLAALGAVVGDAAQDVQFGHVSRRAAARDVVADGAVAVDGS